MNLLAEITAQQAADNRIDHYWYQDTLYFVVFFLTALIGLLIGWLLWRNCKKKCQEIEKENRELLAEYDRLNRA